MQNTVKIKYLIILAACLSTLLIACSLVKKEDKQSPGSLHHRPYRPGVNESPQPVIRGRTARPMRYKPVNGGFSITNGTERFNRPLYIGHDGARLDAGDRPEFAFYLPGKGGVLRLGLISEEKIKWLHEADKVVAQYVSGRMVYTITDSLLGNKKLEVQAVPAAGKAGALIRVECNCKIKAGLFWAYGGLTGVTDFRGDIGYKDIVDCYELKKADCLGTDFEIRGNQFILRKKNSAVSGMISVENKFHPADAALWEEPTALLASRNEKQPVIVGQVPNWSGQPTHILLIRGEAEVSTEVEFESLFEQSVKNKQRIANSISVNTPDPYVNALVPAFNIAADALWDGENWYMHGNVAWRTPLIGWRCVYTGDLSGQSQRTRKHILSSLATQITGASSAKDLQHRPIWGQSKEAEEAVRAFLSEGRLNGTAHYNWNLVLFDALIRHLLWTGDIDFAKKTWPYFKRHLAWEKRLFDRGGLYDALPSIWASDALQYNGGGVTHTSSYNYYHNTMAARIAALVGEDPHPYEIEAQRIINAMQKQLWLNDQGVFAEFKDITGEQKTHSSSALWTSYHSIDSEVPDAFQAWQMGNYVDTRMPHIPVHGEGVPEGNWSVVPSTTWMPYMWSINNVSPDEIYHTALACWQAQKRDLAWRLFMGTANENMYRGICPGNVGMTLSYDAYRGECIRDFGDAIGVLGRAVVEGLFGVVPDMLTKELIIRPGWPADWKYASFRHPSVEYNFNRKGNEDHYTIINHFGDQVNLKLIVPATGTDADVFINRKKVKAGNPDDAIGSPYAVIKTEVGDSAEIVIRWKGENPSTPDYNPIAISDEVLHIKTGDARIEEIKDTQDILAIEKKTATQLSGTIGSVQGYHTIFVRVREGNWNWWMPVELEVRQTFDILTDYDGRGMPLDKSGALKFRIRNNTAGNINSVGIITTVNRKDTVLLDIPARGESEELTVYPDRLLPGRQKVYLKIGDLSFEGLVANWDLQLPDSHFQTVVLNGYFNDRVTEIFKEGKYTTPGRPLVTLGVPSSGYGQWCKPNLWEDYRKKGGIDDSGLRTKALKENGIFRLKCGVPFHIPTDASENNIAFVSQWEIFPEQMTIPLNGRARHAYFLMAGSTYHMQSHFKNGEIRVTYTDGTEAFLPLRNPETWWPIDRDYFVDDYAFQLKAPRPPRILLKTGEEYFSETDEMHIAGSQEIIGGVATVLDISLDPDRELQSLTLRAVANEIVIGLMGVTLAK